MNRSRTLNNHINGLHKRALSLVYNNFSSSFSELLEKDKSVTIHHPNLQTLAYEIYKATTTTTKKKKCRLKYYQKHFLRKKAIIVLEIAQRCRVEVLKICECTPKNC